MKTSVILFLFITFIKLFSAGSLNNVIYDKSACGLNIQQYAAKITTRFISPPSSPMPVTFNVSGLPGKCYEIEAAYVWTILSYTNTTPPVINLNVRNPLNQTTTFPMTLTGQSIAKCWSEAGTRGYRADIKNFIVGNGAYQFEITTSLNEIDGITLLIVYKDQTSTYQGHLKLIDGLVSFDAGTEYTFDLPFIPACDNSFYSKGFYVLSDLQNTVGTQFQLTIDGNVENLPKNFWNSELIDVNVSQNKSLLSSKLSPGNDCWSWIVSGLYYRTNTCIVCPVPNVITVKAQSTSYNICAGDEITLSATGATNYSWTSIPGGLLANQSSVIVKPTTTTRFVIRGSDADDCYRDYDTILVNVKPNPTINLQQQVEICFGDTTQIGANASGGTPGYSYNWTPATGLSATNISTPKAFPNQSTTYTLRVVDNGGCVITGNVLVTVNPLPRLNLGQDVETCFNVPIDIGNMANGGTPGYTYSWTPSTGLNRTDQAMVTANPPSTTTYFVRVTDSKGCLAFDTITVTILPLPLPVINPAGPITICSCDSVTLDAGIGFTKYLWNTGATSQKITVNQTGNYFVTVTDEKGCVNSSSPVNVTVLKPTAVVGLPDKTLEAEPGQAIKVLLNLKVWNLLDTCNSYNWVANISFNKFIMVPTGTTPKGNFDGDLRRIQLSGRRGVSDTLITLDFMATLGDVVVSDINIDSFDWTDCNFVVERRDSNIRLINLCEEGGQTRLFRSPGNIYSLIIKPNPAEYYTNIDFTAKKGDSYIIKLFDNLSNEIQTLFSGELSEDKLNLQFDLTNLSSGTYFLRVISGNGIDSYIMGVRK